MVTRSRARRCRNLRYHRRSFGPEYMCGRAYQPIFMDVAQLADFGHGRGAGCACAVAGEDGAARRRNQTDRSGGGKSARLFASSTSATQPYFSTAPLGRRNPRAVETRQALAWRFRSLNAPIAKTDLAYLDVRRTSHEFRPPLQKSSCTCAIRTAVKRNKVNSKCVLRWNLVESTSLTVEQKALLFAKLKLTVAGELRL